MKLRRAISCASALLGAQLGRYRPVVVSWRLVYRCNLRCQYCHLPMIPTPELTTDQILSTLHGLAQAGTKFVNFTGGEVLLRDDIGAIVECAVGLGISTTMNTNGTHLPAKVDSLRRLSGLTFSLDGEPAVHEAARGKGTHAQAMEAIRLAKEAGIPVSLTAVLSSKNLASVPWLLDLAGRERVHIHFQPARLEKLGSQLPDPITPPLAEYRRVMDDLIREKKNGNRWISNSIAGLEHLATFPAPRELSCHAGKVFFTIEPNGDLLACNDVQRPPVVYNIARDGLEKALEETKPAGCDACWGPSLVELNLAGAFKFEPMLNLVRAR